MCARATVKLFGLQGTARDVSMKVRVDPAVHGQLLQLPVTSVAQDAAEADVAVKDTQTSGGSRHGRTIDTVLQLQIGALAAELLTQPQFLSLATKCHLHSTVDAVTSKHTGGVAKLTLAELVTGNSVHVRLPPFKPVFCQQLCAAAAAGNVSLSVTIVEAGMAADQTTSFGQPAHQTPAVARIQLELLSVRLSAEQTAALPAAGALFSAASNPAAAAGLSQPRLAPEPYIAILPTAGQVSVEQLNGVIRSVNRLSIRMEALQPVVQSHSTGLHQLSRQFDVVEAMVQEHHSRFNDVLLVGRLHRHWSQMCVTCKAFSTCAIQN